MQVGGEALAPFAEELFFSLLRIGFRNIHAIIHHQTENFAAGMPTDLAFRTGGRQAIFRFLEKEHGEGWWGNEALGDLLCRPRRRREPVQLGPGASADDAGDLCAVSVRSRGRGRDLADDGAVPRGGRHGRHGDNTGWYTRTAALASRETGERGRDLLLARLRTLLAG